jgi:hypothetical protein
MDRNQVVARIWETYEAGGLIPACAWCARIRIEGEWLHPHPGALSTIDRRVTLSHSICPRCAEAQRPPKTREARAPRAGRPVLDYALDDPDAILSRSSASQNSTA